MDNKIEKYFFGILIGHRGKSLIQTSYACKKLCIHLRKLEYNGNISNESFFEAIRHIRLIYSLIYQEEFEISMMKYNHLLEELNERYIHYYNFMNTNFINDFKNIRVVIVYKHQQVVKYLKNHFDKDKCLPSMLSFDSHPDVNDIKIESDNNFEDDIGCVHVPVFSHFKYNSGLSWIVPNWVKLCIERTEIKIGQNNDCYTFDNNNNVVSSLYYNVSNIEDIYANIDIISNNYILNIDLDYFVTNGVESDSTEIDVQSHVRYARDVQSYQRCVIDFEHTKNPVYRDKCLNSLSTEMSYIRERIKSFTKFLLHLKSQDKIPSFIIFCNSTNVNFSIEESTLPQNIFQNSGCTNSFIPSYLAFWLLNTVYNEVNIIFDK